MADEPRLFSKTMQRLTQVVKDEFFSSVFEQATEIENRLTDLMAGFFGTLAASIGTDSVPPQIAELGVRWQEISGPWQQAKRSRGNKFLIGIRHGAKVTKEGKRKTPEPHNEKQGLKAGYLSDALAGADAIEKYGRPKVNVSTRGIGLDGREYGRVGLDRRGKLRWVRGAPGRGRAAGADFDPRNKGIGGQFAKSVFASLTATLTVDLLPVLEAMGWNETDAIGSMYQGFSAKNAVKLEAGDMGTSRGRPARPFLSGFLDYYVHVAAPKIVAEYLK